MNSTNHKQRRQFYLLLSVVLLAAGFFKLYKGRPITPYVCFASGVALVLLEFIFKSLGRQVFDWWMKFARLLGTINTTVLLSIIYFLVLTPIGVLKRKSTANSPYGAKACKERKSAWFELPPSPKTAERYSSSY